MKRGECVKRCVTAAVKGHRLRDNSNVRAWPGFEPGTTRTLSEYHTPRPPGRRLPPTIFAQSTPLIIHHAAAAAAAATTHAVVVVVQQQSEVARHDVRVAAAAAAATTTTTSTHPYYATTYLLLENAHCHCCHLHLHCRHYSSQRQNMLPGVRIELTTFRL